MLAPTDERHTVTSDFGPRVDPISKTKKDHKGIDLGTPTGTILRPPDPGHVLTAGYKDGSGCTTPEDAERERAPGRRVVILHPGELTGRAYDYCSAYFHLSEIFVKVGQRVDTTTAIGRSGGDPRDPQAGRSTAPHTHTETRTPPPEYRAVRPVLMWRGRA